LLRAQGAGSIGVFERKILRILGENRKFRTGLRRVSAIAVLFSHRQLLLERDYERLFAIV
jgi:hypothetical protein